MTGSYASTNFMSEIDILNSSVELSTDTGSTPESKPEADVPKEPVKEHTPIETLEDVAQKVDDRVPLKKYMEEKKSRQELETRADELAQELKRIKESGQSKSETNFDIDYLSEKHNIDQEVLKDIINATHSITKDSIRAELEEELGPRFQELDSIKKEKEKQNFESQFNKILKESIAEMPEYTGLVDEDDLKTWIRSGQYSKMTMPELIEKKYGRFVSAKKSIDSGYTASREQPIPEPDKMTDDDWMNIDKNPELKKKWANSLEDRLKKYM